MNLPDYEKHWTKKALEISTTFEGHDPWANIVGNFDGAGLTCGALGWTIKFGNQQRLVKEFVKQHTAAKALKLMPTCWAAYWDVMLMSEVAAIAKTHEWSGGRVTVKSPYKEELRAFWKSEEMIAIQTAFAWKDMGKFAMKKTIEGAAYFRLAAPKFGHFAYWFDQAVMNGTGKTVDFKTGEVVSNKDVVSWCLSESGAGHIDTKKNAKIWEKSLCAYDKDEILLWRMAYLRARMARNEYDTAVMNRRGTLALGEGYVNGMLRQYEWVKLGV